MASTARSIIISVLLAMSIIRGVCAQTPTPEPDLLGGMISCYELDEESGVRSDSVGSNHLSDINTVGYTGGLIGNAAMFFSQNTEYLFQQNHGFPIDNDPRSFFFWVKTSIDYEGLMFYGDEDSGFVYFAFQGYPDGLWLDYGNSAISNLVIDGGQWNLVGFIYDDPDLIIYRNQDSYSTEVLSQFSTYEGVFWIPAPQTEWGEIDIDLLMVWERALSESEVSLLYNSGSGQSCDEIINGIGPEPQGERRVYLSSGDWMTVMREVSYGDLSISIILGILMLGFVLFAIIYTVDKWIRK